MEKYELMKINDPLPLAKDAIFLISWYGCPIGATYSWASMGC
jgi:hypothetical protein